MWQRQTLRAERDLGYSLGQVITCQLICSDQHVQWRPVSVRQTSLKSPTVGLPARDAVFRHMSLWTTRYFTFKLFRWDYSSATPKCQYLQQGMMAGRGVRTLRGLTNQRNSTPEKSPLSKTPSSKTRWLACYLDAPGLLSHSPLPLSTA